MKTIFLLGCMTMSFAVSAQNQLKITGELPMLTNGQTVYLTDFVSKKVDSAIVMDNKFELISVTDSSSIYVLQLGKVQSKETMTFRHLEPGELKISGNVNDLSKATYTGDTFVKLWDEMILYMENATGHDLMYPQEIGAKILEAQQAGDVEASEALSKEFMNYVQKGIAVAKEWINMHPNEGVSVYAVNAFLLSKLPLPEVKEILNGLGEDAKKSRLAHLMLNMKNPA